jgi:Tfp pilus assembly protein PilN
LVWLYAEDAQGKMIEINLLPEELKPKQEKLNILLLRQVLLMIIPAAIGLLIIIHLYLGGLFLFKTLQHKSLNRNWAQLEHQRERVSQWKSQYKVSSHQTEYVNKLLASRITISDKMQSLSEVLPKGVWFNRLNFKQQEIHLEGSVVSLNKEQMRLLNLFINQLKENYPFFKNTISVKLGRINMRTIGGFSVMDFVLEGGK